MSTHPTTPLKPDPPPLPHKTDPAPLPASAYCPTCGQLLPPLQIEEYPKVMYKKTELVATPLIEEPPPATVIVNNPEEEKKKEAEGYSTQVPEPKQPGDHLKQHQDQHGQQQHNQHPKKP